MSQPNLPIYWFCPEYLVCGVCAEERYKLTAQDSFLRITHIDSEGRILSPSPLQVHDPKLDKYQKHIPCYFCGVDIIVYSDEPPLSLIDRRSQCHPDDGSGIPMNLETMNDLFGEIHDYLNNKRPI